MIGIESSVSQSVSGVSMDILDFDGRMESTFVEICTMWVAFKHLTLVTGFEYK